MPTADLALDPGDALELAPDFTAMRPSRGQYGRLPVDSAASEPAGAGRVSP